MFGVYLVWVVFLSLFCFWVLLGVLGWVGSSQHIYCIPPGCSYLTTMVCYEFLFQRMRIIYTVKFNVCSEAALLDLYPLLTYE